MSSVIDRLKTLVLKKRPATGPTDDPRQLNERLDGGRRVGEAENPYLAARRTWNDHVGSVLAERQMLQVLGLVSLMIALAAVGGMTYIGSQSKFIPYLVEVDKLGSMIAAGPVGPSDRADLRVVHASVAEFIGDMRMVTPDVAMQRKAVFRIYAKLSPNDPATAKTNDWLNGTADSSPFKRAAKEMVSIELNSVLQQTADTWQVDWVETTRDRQGIVKGIPANMRALVTVYTAETGSQISEEQLRNNPMAIYVRDFSWSQHQ
jgi:type IV secretion system protein TrbF